MYVAIFLWPLLLRKPVSIKFKKVKKVCACATRYSLFAYSHFTYFRPKSGISLVMFWTIKYTKLPLLQYLDISVQIFLVHISLM